MGMVIGYSSLKDYESGRCLGCGAVGTAKGMKTRITRAMRYGVYHMEQEWHAKSKELSFPMDVMPWARAWQA
eukprot:247341-Amphidinium_carterae.1